MSTTVWPLVSRFSMVHLSAFWLPLSLSIAIATRPLQPIFLPALLPFGFGRCILSYKKQSLRLYQILGHFLFLRNQSLSFFQKFSAYCQRVSGVKILETIYQRIGSTNGSPKISQFLVKISGQIGGSNTCPSVSCAHFLPLVLWVIGAHKCAKVGKEIWIGNDKYLPVRLAYFYCG